MPAEDVHGTRYRRAYENARTVILETPPPGEAFTYLVVPVRALGEGTLGEDRDNAERVNAHPCP